VPNSLCCKSSEVEQNEHNHSSTTILEAHVCPAPWWFPPCISLPGLFSLQPDDAHEMTQPIYRTPFPVWILKPKAEIYAWGRTLPRRGICTESQNFILWGPVVILWHWPTPHLGGWESGPQWDEGVASTRASGRHGHLSAQGSGLEKQKPLQPHSTEIYGVPTFRPNADHLIVKKTGPVLAPQSSESSHMWIAQAECWLFYKGETKLCVSCKLNNNSHHVLSIYCVPGTGLCNLTGFCLIYETCVLMT